jgi:RNA polymerase sigma factor (TIGR02999 family)
MTDGVTDVTALLIQWQGGDKAALDALIPVVYQDLRRVARGRLRSERAGESIQTTALVHEVYLRLVNVDQITLKDRAHFLAVCARLMRQILVDHARRRGAKKRGRSVHSVAVEEVNEAVSSSIVDVLALDRALDDLASHEARLCRVVELKFFAGLTIAEIALALDVSPVTIERDWTVAKAWLYRRLTRHTASDLT